MALLSPWFLWAGNVMLFFTTEAFLHLGSVRLSVTESSYIKLRHVIVVSLLIYVTVESIGIMLSYSETHVGTKNMGTLLNFNQLFPKFSTKTLILQKG